MNTIIVFSVSLALGYYLSLLVSHPKKKHHKLPRVAFKNVQLLPNFKIHRRDKTYHIHHWFLLSLVIALGMVAYEGSRSTVSHIFNGVAFGGVLQGLRYKDRFRFRFPKFDHNEGSRHKK